MTLNEIETFSQMTMSIMLFFVFLSITWKNWWSAIFVGWCLVSFIHLLHGMALLQTIFPWLNQLIEKGLSLL